MPPAPLEQPVARALPYTVTTARGLRASFPPGTPIETVLGCAEAVARSETQAVLDDELPFASSVMAWRGGGPVAIVRPCFDGAPRVEMLVPVGG